MQDSPSFPSTTGLFVFAKREGLWDATASALVASPEAAIEAVRTLLLAFYQTHLRNSLDVARDMVDKVPEIVCQRIAKDFRAMPGVVPPEQPQASKTGSATTMLQQVFAALSQGNPQSINASVHVDNGVVSFHGEKVFAMHPQGRISVRLGTRPTLTTAAFVNKLASLAGIQRPVSMYPDGTVKVAGARVCPESWVTVKNGTGAPKTAASYPQVVSERGGDTSKVKGALEKALQALNLAAVSALKFDDRLMKLEQDVYRLFQEYLEFERQSEMQEAREEAASVTSSLSTPDTDARAGQFDNGDVSTAPSITASSASDEEILTAAWTLSLEEARRDYVAGRMSADLFDAFVPLWEALHRPNGPAELKGALDRGDITQHLYDLGQQLLERKAQKR